MELLKLRDGAYEYYKNFVGDNQDTDYTLATLKLNRAVMLGKKMKAKEERPDRELIYYGNLAIVIENGEIKWLQNYTDRNHNFCIDWNEYNRLSEELGINGYIRNNNKEIAI